MNETYSGTDVYPYFTDDLVVYPYQSQHLNCRLHHHFDLSFEQAKVESSLSVEIAQIVIKHFVDMNKRFTSLAILMGPLWFMNY